MSASTTTRARRARWWALVALLAVVGVTLRLWRLDFDERQHLHPDERHWSLTSSALDQAIQPAPYPTLAGPVFTWLDGQRSPTNAYRGADSFVYGPVTLAATRGVAGWLYDGATTDAQPASAVVHAIDALGVPLLDDAGGARFDTGYNIDLIGRLLGALTDTLTIFVVAAIGRRLGGPRGGNAVGLIAAALHAGSVLAIQHAHFFGSEPLLTLCAAITVWATIRVDRSDDPRRALLSGGAAGLAAGAAVAVKFTAVGLAAVPFVLLVVLAVRHRRRADLIRLAAASVGGILAFRVLCPPAFVGLGMSPNPTFWDDLRRSQQAADAGLPPSIQWADRTPFIDGTWWLFWFTIGPGALVAAVVGVGALVRHRRSEGLWHVATVGSALVVPYLFVFRGNVTSGRYFVPMLPAVAVAGAYGYVAAARWLRPRLHQRSARVVGSLVVVGALAAVVWPLAFVNGVYGDRHTRIVASEWIAEHVPKDSTITAEGWDDALPLAIGGANPTDYRSQQLDLFGVDSVQKTAELAGVLVDVDYVIESSNRVWDAVTRIPVRYPSTIEFFAALDDGRLGFERVATFTSPPELGWFRLHGGEEAFSVYDHPEVRIWQRTREVTKSEAFAVLRPRAAATALPVHPDDASKSGAMLTDDELSANRDSGTFDDQFATSGPLSNPMVQAVAWFAIVALLAVASFVILLPALRRLPDAGAGLAPIVGLVAVAGLVLCAVGWAGIPLGTAVVAVAAGSWLAAGAWCARRRRELLAEVWATRRQTILQAVGVALIGFAVALGLRAANPDLWHQYRGGEKPFELAMLTSMLRARTLPPPDTWFAGGALNYYYGGSLLVSVPARLARTTPALALNLGVAIVGMVAAGASYSAGAALAAVGRSRRGPDTAEVHGCRSRSAIRRAGWLAALFVLVVPNLAIVPSVVRRITGNERGALDWWSLSRVVPDSPIVTEFPAWSLLFGDLHAHLIDLAIVMALVAVLAALFGELRASRAGSTVATLGLIAGLLVGATRAVNAWDFPMSAGALTLVIVWGAIAVRRGWPRSLGPSALAAAGALLGLLVWRPFTSRFEVTDAGAQLNDSFTPFVSWLQQFGLWWAATLVAVVSVALAHGRWWRGAIRRGRSWLVRPRSFPQSMVVPLVVLSVVGMSVLVVAAMASGRVVLVITAATAIACAGAGLAAWRSPGLQPVSAGACWCLAAGWTVVAGVELATVINDFDRMNTVFKGWFHAWALLGVGSAAALAGALRTRAHARRARRVVRSGALAVLVVAALATTAFVQLAVPARLDDRVSGGGASLDGLAYLAVEQQLRENDTEFSPGEDLPLIEWLQANARGQVTIIEAPGRGYAWTSRVSALTGLPAVVGWPYHESQQRRSYGQYVDLRSADVAEFYTSGDRDLMLDVLWRYDVRYIVYGTAERVLSGVEGADAIERLPCVSIAMRDGDTFVGAVDSTCLDDRALPIVLRRATTSFPA